MKIGFNQPTIGYALLGLLTLGLLAGAFPMIMGTIPEMDALGTNVVHYLPILGIIKLAGAICLWLPRARRIAGMVLTGYMGGAMMAGIIIGDGPWMAGIFLVLLWVALQLVTGDFLFRKK